VKLYKKKGLGLNTKIDLGGECHNWEIGNLSTKKNKLSFKNKERRPEVFKRVEREVLNL
jgi:hypothetical protein